MNKREVEQITNFIYETGGLSRTPRSGLWFLGSGRQSVAEHTLRTVFIAYALCYFVPKANKERVLFVCLVHDIAEGRTSDLNHLHQRYGRLAESLAIEDIAANVPFGEEIKGAYQEEHARQTLEAKIAKDADLLEWITTLREEEVKGNIKARSWIVDAARRITTKEGKTLFKKLLATHPDAWWFDQKSSRFVIPKEEERAQKPLLRRKKSRKKKIKRTLKGKLGDS